MSKIALFFGSFNPIHYGHIAIAKYVLEETDVDKVLLIVSPNNPFKSNFESADKRLEDARAAIAQSGLDIEVSDIEFYLPKPLYTVQTLFHLSIKHPENEYIVIMGGDNIETLHSWYHGADIINNYKIWVYPRPGYNAESAIKRYLEEYHPKGITLLDAPMYDISSTRIRESRG